LLPNGAIQCDPVEGTTDAADIFVAGDLAYGPKLLIHAVASGKAVARAIYQRITGHRITTECTELHFPDAQYTREAGYEKLTRITPPALSPEDRMLGQDRVVELDFTEKQARCEASRCLNCGVNTIFDGYRCILCGGCVDVCPEKCLSIVAALELADTGLIRDVVDAQLDDFPREEASAILKDETTCIRCGLCAERCPTGAITMEAFRFKESLKCQVV